MPDINATYKIVTMLSIVMILTSTCCLFGFTVPQIPSLKNYRISRRLLVCAYVILSLAGTCELLTDVERVRTDLILAFTLMVASFQAFLFTASMVILLHTQSIKLSKLLFHVFFILLLSSILLISLFYLSPGIFKIVFNILLCCYVLQLIYYIYWFRIEYTEYNKQINNFFSEDEERRMSWIKKSFFMALTIGIMSIVSLFCSLLLYTMFVAAYTVFYVYFAVKTINYANGFLYLSAASTAVLPEKNNTVPGMEAFVPALEKWIDSKQFVTQGITLSSLSNNLNTNQTYLSNYINTTTNQNFRYWISRLRIEEAQRLLIQYKDEPVSNIGEMVGISNKSSFFRQFVNITGETPGEYREKKISK